jgi:hypothetical protein
MANSEARRFSRAAEEVEVSNSSCAMNYGNLYERAS